MSTSKPKTAKQRRHELQEKAAMLLRAKASSHLKEKNVLSHAEIIAPMPKNATNHRDNTLELVRKRKAMQMQSQQEDAAKRQKVAAEMAANPSSSAPPAAPPPPIAIMPKAPTWIEAANSECPDIKSGTAKHGYGLPSLVTLPDGVTLPKDWTIVFDATSKLQYFWNRKTNETRWGDPNTNTNKDGSNATTNKGSDVEEVEKFHVAVEHGMNRSYYWDPKSGQTSFDHVALTELTKPPVDEDAPEPGAPEGFQDAAGDIPRFEYLRNKALKERANMLVQKELEMQQATAARKADLEDDE